MGERPRTLGELVAPNLDEDSFNIIRPNVPNFKAGPSIISSLPIFNGKVNENPHKH